MPVPVLTFDFDPEKAASNLKKLGVSFDEAMTVFDDPQAAGGPLIPATTLCPIHRAFVSRDEWDPTTEVQVRSCGTVHWRLTHSS